MLGVTELSLSAGTSRSCSSRTRGRVYAASSRSHSTALGPSLGGVRFWNVRDERDALVDVLRLSEAMSLKAAVAGLAPGRRQGRRAARRPACGAHRKRSCGRSAAWIDALGGRYIAAEDVDATQADMDGIALETPWVTGVDPARGGRATRRR